jgi:hypothetical protein
MGGAVGRGLASGVCLASDAAAGALAAVCCASRCPEMAAIQVRAGRPQ